MDKDQEIKFLKKWGFKGRVDFEKTIKDKIEDEDLEFIAPKIFVIFEDKVTEWKRKYLANRKERFVAEVVSPPKNRFIKDPRRIGDKIIESWESYSKWQKLSKREQGKAPEKHDPINFLNTMNDVIRFRILCNYLSDVDYIDKKILNFTKNYKKIKLQKRDNYIETPYPERRVGHRALQYIFQYFEDKKRQPLFEVQVMTQLQHAWDKKDHYLIYEYVRINKDGKIPLHLKNRMAAMSEVLYVADTVFDTLRDEIIRIMGEK